QDDREVLFEQAPQRFLAGVRHDEVLFQILQDGAERQQLFRQIIDDQNVDLVGWAHRAVLPVDGVPRRLRRSASEKRYAASGEESAEQPGAKDGQQLLGVDRLGQVIPGPGLQTLLAI